MTTEEAFNKLKMYCAYQERCHQEVRYKLINYKVFGSQLEDIMSDLVRENFLNEERFARAYVRGKHRIKKWGRNKILNELRRRQISEYCMKKGMAEIVEEDYQKILNELLTKYITVRSSRYKTKELHFKAFSYAMNKGYEVALIKKTLEKLSS